MAKVLQENVQHNGEFIEKGTKFDSKNPVHKEIENFFGDGEAKADAPASAESDGSDGQQQTSDKTKAELLKEIETAGATPEDLEKYGKLNKTELLVVHAEIVG